MPAGVRTKSASPKTARNRASALETAGCVSPRRAAAAVTARSRSTASNTRSRLRSTSWIFTMVINIIQDIDLTNGYPLPTLSSSPEESMKRPVALALAALVPALACAQEVTLRLVSAFPENQHYVKRTIDWIEKLNKEAKGTLQINFIGGPQAIPTLEGGNPRQTGRLDPGPAPRAFFTHVLPRADLLNRLQARAAAQR